MNKGYWLKQMKEKLSAQNRILSRMITENERLKQRLKEEIKYEYHD